MAACLCVRRDAAPLLNRTRSRVVCGNSQNWIPAKLRAQMRIIRRAAPGVFRGVEQFRPAQFAEPRASGRHNLHESHGSGTGYRARIVPAFRFCQRLDFVRIHSSAARCVLINLHRGRRKQKPAQNQEPDFELPRHLLQASSTYGQIIGNSQTRNPPAEMAAGMPHGGISEPLRTADFASGASIAENVESAPNATAMKTPVSWVSSFLVMPQPTLRAPCPVQRKPIQATRLDILQARR